MRVAAKFLVFAMVLGLLAATPGSGLAKEKPVLLKVPITFSTELPGSGSTIRTHLPRSTRWHLFSSTYLYISSVDLPYKRGF